MFMRALFTIAFSYSLAGCSLSYRETVSSNPSYNPHREARQFIGRGRVYIDPTTMPDSGFYYMYEFSEDHRLVAHVDQMLSDLYSRGFDILVAWYRGESSGCAPPGSLMSTGTIYGPEFILLVGRSDPGLVTFRFRKMTSTPTFVCPYSVTEYRAEDK